MIQEGTTALVYGTVGIIIFLFPYTMYAKEFFSENGSADKGNYFQIVGKTIAYHLTFVFAATALTSIIDIMMSFRPSFSPKEGMKLFYNAGGNWQQLISYLIHFSGNHSQDGANYAKDSEFAYQIVLNYYGVALAFFMFLVPVIVIAISLSMAFKNNNGEKTKMSDKLLIATITYVFITFLVWFHAMLSSTYVSIFIGTDFSFFKIMTSLWHTILLG